MDSQTMKFSGDTHRDLDDGTWHPELLELKGLISKTIKDRAEKRTKKTSTPILGNLNQKNQQDTLKSP